MGSQGEMSSRKMQVQGLPLDLSTDTGRMEGGTYDMEAVLESLDEHELCHRELSRFILLSAIESFVAGPLVDPD